MSRLILTVEGPDIVLDLLARGLEDARQVTVVPDTIFPGYVCDVISAKVTP